MKRARKLHFYFSHFSNELCEQISPSEPHIFFFVICKMKDSIMISEFPSTPEDLYINILDDPRTIQGFNLDHSLF